MPLPPLGNKDVRPEGETEDSAGAEIAEDHALSAPELPHEQSTTRGKDANGNRKREKRLALVRAQIESLADVDVIAENRRQQQAKNG